MDGWLRKAIVDSTGWGQGKPMEAYEDAALELGPLLGGSTTPPPSGSRWPQGTEKGPVQTDVCRTVGNTCLQNGKNNHSVKGVSQLS